MVNNGKDVVDVVAASTAVLTLAAWLPPMASLFTIIWMALRIYESDTVQKMLGKKLREYLCRFRRASHRAARQVC